VVLRYFHYLRCYAALRYPGCVLYLLLVVFSAVKLPVLDWSGTGRRRDAAGLQHPDHRLPVPTDHCQLQAWGAPGCAVHGFGLRSLRPSSIGTSAAITPSAVHTDPDIELVTEPLCLHLAHSHLLPCSGAASP
jgi:hypothetical protein